VGEVAIVPDTVRVVAERLRQFMARFDLVITTGGIGPTHDDITFEAVALALDRPLVQRPELLAIAQERKRPLNDAARKLTMIPEGAELLEGGDFIWPPVKVDNVVVLPGIPRLVVAQFGAIARMVTGPPPVVMQVKCWGHEVALAEAAARTDEEFPEVEVGSYPIWDGEKGHVLVRFTARAMELSERAANHFLAGLPAGLRTDSPEECKTRLQPS